MSAKSYYDILGVKKGATSDEITKAYRELVRKYHPDTNKDPESEKKMAEVNEAYSVLSNQEKRAKYDQFGTVPPTGSGGYSGGGFGGFNFTEDMGSFSDIFDAMFGGGGGARRRPRGHNVVYEGADIRTEVSLTLEEAYQGKKVTVTIPRYDKCPDCGGTGAKEGSKPKTCPECNGTGQVRRTQQTILGTFQTATTCPKCGGEGKIIDNPCTTCNGNTVVKNTHKIEVDIPAGIEDGMRVRVRGQGDAGKNGGTSGDLYVYVRVKPHKIFRREGADLFSSVSISMYEAALGRQISVFTINGKENINIKAGTQPDEMITLRGKGMPRVSGRGRGDHIITLKVQIPKKLSKEEQNALRKFL
ncbi:MAG TPA: molecular chaperone DnaJ [Caldisericia bacterium]|nr:molecular chaperone DnaJ [Caldisericia bacterium]HRV74497.1 molecular chaperone DnaJ [Caldisericia bacterium]